MTNIKNDLDWVFEVGDALATYVVKMTLATNLFNLVFEIKIAWNGNSIQELLVRDQFALHPHVYTIGCKFCVVMPFCVQTYNCRIYYVAHKLDTLLKHPYILGCMQILFKMAL